MRLAVLQAPAELGSITERLEWLDNTLKGLKADLALCPELFATGYNIGAQVLERAETADGPISQALKALAQKHGLALHCSFAERSGEIIYNAAQCWGADGTRLLHQRKLAIPPGPERDHYSAAEGCTLFTLRGFKIATLICYDIEFTEAARFVASQGVDLCLVPTALSADWGWVARTMVPSRAYENGMFLAYANHAGHDNGLKFLGESFIAAPDGIELARAGAAPEILLATLEQRRVSTARARLPYLAENSALKLFLR